MSSLSPAPARPVRSAASTYDVRRLREEFPILRQKIHGKPLAYFDNAATSQKPRIVLDTLNRYYEHDNANVHRANHLLSERATRDYEQARITVQHFLNAPCLREIIFTKGTTDAINLVAHSFGKKHLKPGDEVLITWLEHHSNIVPWQMICEETGAKLVVVPVNDVGELRMDEFNRLLGPRTKIVSVAHVSNALGTINPVKEIIAKAHQLGAAVLVDGAQAVPHLRVDVRDLDCDFYVFSGHKVYGPTGIGALFGKPEHLERMPPYQGGGDMIRSVSFPKTTYNELPYKFEAGTPNIAGAIGLAAAIEYVNGIGQEAIAAHEHKLLLHATAAVNAIPGIRIVGQAANKAAVLSFVVEQPTIANLDIGTMLDLEGIAVRTGHHCCQPLMERFGVPGTVRASFGLYNTLEEVDRFAEALRAIVDQATGRAKPQASKSATRVVYPAASAASPDAAAEELAEVFDVLGDWGERYQHIIELGSKIPPLPEEFRIEPNRVKGCQSTVFMTARQKPGAPDVVEFIADSDAELVRGLIAVLEKLYSGQPAAKIVAFDVMAFFTRLGLDHHLSMGRRNGLAAMVQRVRDFAGRVAAGK